MGAAAKKGEVSQDVTTAGGSKYGRSRDGKRGEGDGERGKNGKGGGKEKASSWCLGTRHNTLVGMHLIN